MSKTTYVDFDSTYIGRVRVDGQFASLFLYSFGEEDRDGREVRPCEAFGVRDTKNLKALRDALVDAFPPKRPAASTVVGEILAERERQIAIGYDVAHDDGHSPDLLAQAAIALVCAHSLNYPDVVPWPWTDHGEHTKKTWRQDAIRAAAMLVAAVERHDRQEAGKP